MCVCVHTPSPRVPLKGLFMLLDVEQHWGGGAHGPSLYVAQRSYEKCGGSGMGRHSVYLL